MIVAVLGASGFVGTRLVEQLWADDEVEVRPFIHSSGAAAQLARHGRPLQSVDVLSQKDLERALAGCTHVVNCSRGSQFRVMYEGLRNILSAASTHGVQRVVHLSSVAIYGPAFETRTVVDESYPPRVTRGLYAWQKLKQDELIRKAVSRGLPCVTVCPPNIVGPGSSYYLEVLEALRGGRFVYVEDGDMPCDQIDVANLAHAITLALTCSEADGRRIFVTNDESTTWREVVDALSPVAGAPAPPRSMPLAEAVSFDRARAKPSISVRRALKHMTSWEVRAALKKDPLFSSFEKSARSMAARLPEPAQAFIKGRRKDARRGGAAGKAWDNVSERLVNQQLRNAYYSCDRAKEILGFHPIVSFGQSTDAFKRWYRAHSGFGSDAWNLVSELNRSVA